MPTEKLPAAAGLAPSCQSHLNRQILGAKTWLLMLALQSFTDRGGHHNDIDMPVPKWRQMEMAHGVDEHRQRITARVSDRVRDTQEQAAELLGATVNQFVPPAAYVEAQRVIERESVIRLSQKDAHKVLALLDNPPKPNKRLKDAVKAFKGTVRA